MDFFKKIKEWFYESNHDEHFWAGGLIFTISFFLCMIMNLEVYQMIIVSDFVVLIAMATAEYKDDTWGGKFDWEDILAGLIAPIGFTLLSLIIWLVLG